MWTSDLILRELKMEEDELTKMSRRLNSAMYNLRLKRFGKMSPSEIVDYLVKKPDCREMEKYLADLSGTPFIDNVIQEAEKRQAQNFGDKKRSKIEEI